MQVFVLTFKDGPSRTLNILMAACSCWCNDWRSVRSMLRYYGRDEVTVHRVKWQRPQQFWKR